MKTILLALWTVIAVSCNTQRTKTEPVVIESPTEELKPSQIGEYVVDIFQDSKDNLWFGTLEKGVAKYDGNKLVYLTTNDGLPSNRIVDVIEDNLGNLWFGTGSGLSKFDGVTYTNYSEKDGLCSDMISNLFIDSKGIFWIGTWGGVCKLNGSNFEKFAIPYPDIETMINPDTKDWVTTITEDSDGSIWFGRDGYAASRYDGKSFTHLTTKDGLNSNNVQSIIEDDKGNIWIGTRVAEKDNPDVTNRSGEGGLNKYDGTKITHFSAISGLSQNDVYGIYHDYSKDIWISTISNGVYKYNNNNFTNYIVPHPVMTFLKDNRGKIWLGCAGGLYQITADEEVINVKTNGPWN